MSKTSRFAWAAAAGLATTVSLHAAVQPDTLQATGGAITIQPIMHAAVQIRHGNQVITVDPTAMGGDYNTLPKADLILVTDIHQDHLDAATAAKAAKPNATILAPMAGVTDKPFRLLCKRLGAGYAVSEMTTSDPRLWRTRKSRQRLDHGGEPAPIGVQIAGADPVALAAAARHAVEQGAEIVDINMGCPAKKVCSAWAGSALLQDETLVARIVHAVVESVTVPVTLKIRTGWSRENRNGVRIARIAESAGIAAIAVHGRTRDMLYTGQAEYETIAAIKASVGIPVIANGDVTTPAKAREVLALTGADAVMVGRAAQEIGRAHV